MSFDLRRNINSFSSWPPLC